MNSSPKPPKSSPKLPKIYDDAMMTEAFGDFDDTKDNIKNIEIPDILKNTELLLKKTVDKYEKEEEIFNKSFKIGSDKDDKESINSLIKEIFLDKINKLLSPSSSNKYINWIGGSRSWNNYYIKTTGDEKMINISKEEKTALLKNDWNIYYILKNMKNIEDLTIKIEDLIDIFVKEVLNKTIKIDGCKFFYYKTDNLDLDNKTFPSNQFTIYLDYSKARTIKKKQRTANAMTILTLDIYCFGDNFDMIDFKNNYISTNDDDNLNYLNENGLFLFNRFISNMRKDKGINIDELRKTIFWNIYKGDKAQLFFNNMTLYKTIWTKYNNCYGNKYNNIYNENTEKKLIFDTLLTNNNIKKFYDDFQANIIELLRKYINSCIKYINDKIINEDPIFKEKAFVFIIGGDAFRRYNIGNITKDIDIKLYYKLLNKTDLTKLKLAIINCLSKFISKCSINRYEYMYNHYNYDKTINNYYMNGNKNIFVNIINDNNLQYRLRHIEKNDYLPVDLFSVDYRTVFNHNDIFEYRNANNDIIREPIDIKMNIDIPILDVVLQELNNDDFNKIKEMLGNNLKLSIPYATKAFLIYDIDKTYNNEKNTLLRIMNSKNVKDSIRINELRENKTSRNTLSVNRTYLNNYSDKLYKELDNKDIISDLYNDYFITIMKHHLKDRSKITLPFIITDDINSLYNNLKKIGNSKKINLGDIMMNQFFINKQTILSNITTDLKERALSSMRRGRLVNDLTNDFSRIGLETIKEASKSSSISSISSRNRKTGLDIIERAYKSPKQRQTTIKKSKIDNANT